jgi:hypothetical protein
MGKLQQLGELHGTDKATWHKYCDFYESVLPGDIGALLEIGVKNGASLKMWRDYYLGSIIIGIDTNEQISVGRCHVFRSDATVVNVFGESVIDIIIDDGSHLCSHQRKSFDLYWRSLKPGGFYIIEDVHSSFLGEYADESPTTYEWAMKLPGAMEWWRDPSNKSDSGTIIIPKTI